MARGVGLEFDGARARAAVVDGGRRPRIVAFAEVPVSPDGRPPAERAREAVAAALAKAGGARGRIAASLDAGEAVLRELTLPFTSEEQLRATVPFELESLIHNHAIGDLVVDYLRGPAAGKGTHVLAAGVPRPVVEERLQLLASAGADPAILDLDVAALFVAMSACGAIAQDEPFLVVYGGARYTKVLLVEQRRPRSARSIRYSPGGPPPPAPEGSPKDTSTGHPSPIVVLTETQWERHEGAPGGDSFVGILAREISRFLLSSTGTASPTHLLLAGDFDPGAVAEPLSKAVGLPVRALDLLAGAEHPFGDDARIGRQCPVAVGLALKAADVDPAGTDFRRGDYSYAKKFDAVKSTGLVAAWLALLLVGLVALHAGFRLEERRAALRRVHEYQAQVAADAIHHSPDQWPAELKEDPSRSRDHLRQAHAALKAEVGEGDHPVERSALDLAGQVWKALEQFQKQHGSQKIEDQAFYASIDGITVTQQPLTTEEVSVVLTGQIRNPGFGEALKKKLKSVEPYSDPAWALTEGPYTPEKDAVRFSFTLKRGKK